MSLHSISFNPVRSCWFCNSKTFDCNFGGIVACGSCFIVNPGMDFSVDDDDDEEISSILIQPEVVSQRIAQIQNDVDHQILPTTPPPIERFNPRTMDTPERGIAQELLGCDTMVWFQSPTQQIMDLARTL